MFYLDFFSKSPQMFIFKKESNKTSFGGFLFIIYIIIMLGITAIYTINFIINDKYKIEYSLIKNTKDNGNFLNTFEELNPTLNFSFDLETIKKGESGFYVDGLDNEKFKILDENTGKEIEIGDFIQNKVSKFHITLIYKCEDEKCIIPEEEKGYFGLFTIKYNGFELDHQSNSIPLNKDSNKTFEEIIPFSFDQFSMNIFKWEVIIYKEERGILKMFDNIFNIKSDYISGYLKDSFTIPADNSIYMNYSEKNIKVISSIMIENRHSEYTEYKRQKVSVLSLLANIGALFSTIYACFIFFFKYYSTNYDNYNIMKNILNNNKIIKSNKSIELGKFPNNSLNDFNSDNKNIINEPLISDIGKGKDMVINDNEGDKENKLEYGNNENGEPETLEKLSFIHFLLNNIGFLKKIKGKETLTICRDIYSKYTSIELLLYNQIMFENLLKDYKWNDPNYNNIGKNEFIIKLKKKNDIKIE